MLHPKRQPARTHNVKTADGLHTLHIQEYGDVDRASCSVCYFHGGPGGGTPPDTSRLFDPETFHLVVFDQRGCGCSACDDRLRANTTDLLIQDVEMVRTALGIERWGIMGSSYGSLLVALYAARHAARVSWALLHGVFLGSRAEIAWLYEEGGASRFYPQQWDDFAGFAAEAASELHDESGGPSAEALASAHVDAAGLAAFEPPPKLLSQYHAIINLHPSLSPSLRANPLPTNGVTKAGPPPPSLVAAAAALTRWEDEMETLAPCPATHEPGELVAGAMIALHYFLHGCFLPQPKGAVSELAAEGTAAALARIPCAIIHGRHDVVCTPRAAAALHSLWPHSTLRIVEGGAHALFEKPMRAAAQACLAELTQCGGSAAAAGAAPKRRRT